MEKHAIIAIGREYGSHGLQIGKHLADDLGIPYYDQDILRNAAKKSGIDLETLQQHDEHTKNNMFYSLMMSLSPVASFPEGESLYQKLYQIQVDSILDLAAKGPCVFIGRCADYILRDKADCLTVFIHADMKFRAERIVREYGEREQSPEDRLRDKDKRRAAYHRFYTDMKWGDYKNYDIALNSGKVGIDKCVEILKSLY